jgi:hypothetical protein
LSALRGSFRKRSWLVAIFSYAINMTALSSYMVSLIGDGGHAASRYGFIIIWDKLCILYNHFGKQWIRKVAYDNIRYLFMCFQRMWHVHHQSENVFLHRETWYLEGHSVVIVPSMSYVYWLGNRLLYSPYHLTFIWHFTVCKLARCHLTAISFTRILIV